jgi:hypothetical protein
MANIQTYTLSELRESVRRKLDDMSYAADVIDESANDFQYELFANHRIRLMETSSTLSFSEGDYEKELDDNAQTILAILVQATSPYNIVKNYILYEDFIENHPGFASANGQSPREWTDFGNAIRLAAPALADIDLVVDFLRTPSFMDSDSSEAEIPRSYKEMHVLGTLVRVMEINEDYAEAGQERDKLDPMITSFVRNYGRGQIKTGPVVMRTGRGRRTWSAKEF